MRTITRLLNWVCSGIFTLGNSTDKEQERMLQIYEGLQITDHCAYTDLWVRGVENNCI